jgi:hypothetical protein
MTAILAAVAPSQPVPWIPADLGWQAWTNDIADCTASTLLTGGLLYLTRVNIRAAITATGVVLNIGVAGVGLTAAQNFAGLYSSAGVLLGSSADQSAVWTTIGAYAMPFAGGPVSLPAGFYWVAAVANAATTLPSLTRQSALATAAVANAGFTAATARFATSGGGLTALPASITPSSNVLLNAPLFGAVY